MTIAALTLPLLALLGCSEGIQLSVPDNAGTGMDTGATDEVEDDDGGVGGADSGDDDDLDGCDLDDMVWAVEVRLHDGTPVHMAEPDEDLTLVGLVRNPCAEPVSIELPGSCMVEAFDVIDLASGDGDYESLSCLNTGRTTELQPDGCDETALPWGSIGPGEYQVTAHFAVDDRDASTELVIR